MHAVASALPLGRLSTQDFFEVCLVFLLCSAPCLAGDLADGIYAQKTRGEGHAIKRNDGAEVILGKRLGQAFGKATIRSLANDNSRFVLELKNAGPFAHDPATPYIALVINGICLGVWGQSDPHFDGTSYLSSHIFGDEAAEKVARRLKTQPKRRTHPGHRFVASWSPEKESFRMGEVVKLKLEIRNVGDAPFTFRVGGQQRGLRDNQFRFLAYRTTHPGKAVPDSGDPQNHGGLMSYKTLEPGKSYVTSITLDKWFRFPEPEGYEITGLFEMNLLDRGFRDTIWDDMAVGECAVRIVPAGTSGQRSR